jgi:hypothetical protein
MDYDTLDDAGKRSILTGKLALFEQQHFNAIVSARVADAADDTQASEYREHAEQIEKGIVAVRAMLEELPPGEVVSPRLSFPSPAVG